MKKLLLILFIFSFSSFALAKDKWTIISLTYSSGPVSPQYQSTWTLTIDNERNATYTSKGAGTDTTYSFTVSKSKFNKLVSYINKYKLISADPNSMKTDNMKIGGSSNTVTLTVQNADPNTDQPPRKIEFPSQQNEEWTPKMNNVVKALTNCIPGNNSGK